MNTHVKFEIAKLLKEKGFDLLCSDYYTQRGGLMSDGWGDIIYEQGFGTGEPDIMLKFDYSDFSKSQKETCFLCPTITEVVMWLYEKHEIWVEVRKSYNESFIAVVKSPRLELNRCSSPTEAYEAAIEYTLKNLI